MIKVRKLGKAPKHKLAALRNMACSLVKHERIETTGAKALELKYMLERCFGILYGRSNNSKSLQERKLKSIFTCPGAYTKLITNIKPKLQNCNSKEFLMYFSRMRYKSCAKMFVIEFAKNPIKRAEDKKKIYLDNYLDNRYYDWEMDVRKNHLSSLLTYHLELTTVLKMIHKKLNSKPEFTKADAVKAFKVCKTKLINHLSQDIIKLFENIHIGIEKNKILKFGEYLSFFSEAFSNLSHDIEKHKFGVKKLKEIGDDGKLLTEYNYKHYIASYKKEISHFEEIYKTSQGIISKSKQGVRKVIGELKSEEANKLKLVNFMLSRKTDSPDELSLFREPPKKSKAVLEIEKTYHKNYVTGDESGFSGLEDLENKPEELVKLKRYFGEVVASSLNTSRKSLGSENKLI